MRQISFSPPDITQREIDEVVDSLKSGWITTGPKTKQLEKLVAERCHVDKAVCLNSNTACTEMTLRILGIGPGDEVIVPAYTYTASASVVEHVGAKLVLIDCQKDGFNMDYEQLENSITNKTKVIIPVDLFGIPANYDRIFEIVNRKKEIFSPSDNKYQKAFGRIVVLADAAHAFGASYHGEMIGSIADFTSFSFHAVKNLTTAEGGAVTWNSFNGIDNDELYHTYMLYSLHGQSKDAFAKSKLGAWEYDIIAPWFKCNMTDVHASIGLGQLSRYDEILNRRREIIEKMNEAFKTLPVKLLTHYSDSYQSSGHLYIVRLYDKDGNAFNEKLRNKFIVKMAESGIATNVHYKPLPMHTAYKNLGFSIDNYKNAFEQYKNEVTLPLHTCLSDEDVSYIIEKVTNIIQGELYV